MLRADKHTPVDGDAELSLQSYAGQLDSLFSDANTFLIASASACFSILVVAVRTGSMLITAAAVLLAVSTAVRFGSMQVYRR